MELLGAGSRCDDTAWSGPAKRLGDKFEDGKARPCIIFIDATMTPRHLKRSQIMDAGSHAHVRLSEQQRRQFERDGYLCPVRVLDDREVERYFNSYMEYSAANKAQLDTLPPNQKYKVLSETHFVLPWVYEIVTHPRMLDAVEGLLGPNLIAWNSNWFTKMPGEKSFVSWHQDGTYWKLNPPTVVTAWVALSPSAARQWLHAHDPGDAHATDDPAAGNLPARERLVSRPGNRRRS